MPLRCASTQHIELLAQASISASSEVLRNRSRTAEVITLMRSRTPASSPDSEPHAKRMEFPIGKGIHPATLRQ
jgi:hypothetical protein